MTEIFQHTYANGLVLLAEPVPGAQSLAMSLLTPAAVAYEPTGKQGLAALLAEMVERGAGERDAKQHSDALDHLGIHRSSGAGVQRYRLGATMIGSKLPEALPLLIDMIRKPRLEAAALDPSKDLALQALDALDDEPQEKVFVELRKRHNPAPFGRSSLGVRQDIESLTLEDVKTFWQRTHVPQGSVIAFAGRFDWEQLKDLVENQLGDWKGSVAEPKVEAEPARGYLHENAETTQVHIGLAYDAVPEPDEHSIFYKAMSAVLSGGMSGRLFTEVREKRGLCYAVSASYSGTRDRGMIIGYSGTTAPRAQETLDVFTHELRRVSEGVAPDEFERAIVGMKSRLVMQGESTGARAAAIASDQFVYGRPRSLSELAEKVDSITLEKLNAFVKANPAGPMTIVTVGPNALELKG